MEAEHQDQVTSDNDNNWTCYGKEVSSVRSKSNVLLVYVSNFLTVFFILNKMLLESGVSFHILKTRTQLHM